MLNPNLQKATLADWVKVVDNATNCICNNKALSTSTFRAGSGSQSDNLVTCWVSFHQSANDAKIHKIMSNFGAASFHLCYFLEVSIFHKFHVSLVTFFREEIHWAIKIGQKTS
jgi:hypothetical protein